MIVLCSALALLFVGIILWDVFGPCDNCEQPKPIVPQPIVKDKTSLEEALDKDDGMAP